MFRSTPLSIVRITAAALRSLVLVSLLFTMLTPLAAQQRAIQNASVEAPSFADNKFFFYAEGTVPGWLTTHPMTTNGCSNGGASNNINCRAIERWSNTFNGVSPAAGAGSRWVELNAHNNSMMYQTVCMTTGESFDYSFLHRGRSSAGTADVAQFRIGIPTGLPSGSKAADSYDFPIVQVSTTNNGAMPVAPSAPSGSGLVGTPLAAGNGWVRYSGTYTYTGPTQSVNIGFSAVSTAGGDISVGNFIDDWQIYLSPYVEVAATTASGSETTNPGGSATPSGGPSIRVGGSLPAPVTVNVKSIGGTATIGVDYSLTVPFSPLNTTDTATVTIPAGVYDGASAGSIFPVPFSVNPDNQIEPNETVNFDVTGVTGATLSSITSCGNAPATTGTYTIVNDDVVTAAEVSLAGRVTTGGASPRPLAGATVTLTGLDGGTRSTRTNPFGYYSFGGLQAGSTYVAAVSVKGQRFTPRLVTMDDNLTGFDFEAQVSSLFSFLPVTGKGK